MTTRIIDWSKVDVDQQPRITVTVQCLMCRESTDLTLPLFGYQRWRRREALIQDAMPSVPAAERELLISKTCPHCFSTIAGDPR